MSSVFPDEEFPLLHGAMTITHSSPSPSSSSSPRCTCVVDGWVDGFERKYVLITAILHHCPRHPRSIWLMIVIFVVVMLTVTVRAGSQTYDLTRGAAVLLDALVLVVVLPWGTG